MKVPSGQSPAYSSASCGSLSLSRQPTGDFSPRMDQTLREAQEDFSAWAEKVLRNQASTQKEIDDAKTQARVAVIQHTAAFRALLMSMLDVIARSAEAYSKQTGRKITYDLPPFPRTHSRRLLTVGRDWLNSAKRSRGSYTHKCQSLTVKTCLSLCWMTGSCTSRANQMLSSYTEVPGLNIGTHPRGGRPTARSQG